MNEAKNKRLAALSNAALEKKRLAAEATDKAIRSLTISNQPITVANVARLAGVSTSYIYKYPELRERINSLRTQQHPIRLSQNTASISSQATVIYTLREEVKRLNSLLIKSKQDNQLLIGQIYQQQDSQKLIEHLQSENKKQAEQIQQLHQEIKLINQELKISPQDLFVVNHPSQSTSEEINPVKMVDKIINSEITFQLEKMGIKLNPGLTELIESSTEEQVQYAIAVVKETLSKGTKVRSKVGLFKTSLASV
ncbi:MULTISPECIES: DUF6262 family protein [Anabaena]|uniref:Transposase n=2 Tax=Anabaena TaxID=1163 RepID=K9ZC24_ANACC|nr:MULTISPECIES: DUF6262 family protein [Anabaena]AFZ56706.1 hypothetical protein Anacy_1144 [Anabaena cylindrica PCC 7122]MBY5285572.1 hypothetical protein [Anabaena sp. CCAP 1446/1C]MBY5311243.1 hypothetical protein [Anabaena sp. CCAP 1446/1C]MCM2409028.1 hypothetical protein [Anabaena sp. CCAP 1446/1C]BAY00792.1 hypothetical protein NIES19_00180 [Anabaena cylindrica PCC 7122]